MITRGKKNIDLFIYLEERSRLTLVGFSAFSLSRRLRSLECAIGQAPREKGLSGCARVSRPCHVRFGRREGFEMLQFCRGLSVDHSWGDIEGGKEEADVVRARLRLMHAHMAVSAVPSRNDG